jgi:Branched-chain amino acid transport system / permease component
VKRDTKPPPAAAPTKTPGTIAGIRLSTWTRGALIGGLVVALALPFAVKSFLVFQLTLALTYALAILGLNLLTGFNGQFSLGHGAFFGIGAYTAAILMEQAGTPYYWTLPAAGVVCFAVGFLFGLPALRLQGNYLALATFALAIALPQLLKSTPLEPWTGGVQGIVIIKPDAPFNLPLTADQWLYLFTVAVAIVMYAAAINLVHSRTGRAIMAIRDNPIAASAMGVNVALYKTLTFGVSDRRCRRARRHRGAVRGTGQLHLQPLHCAVCRARNRWRRLDTGHAVCRPVRAVCSQYCRGNIQRLGSGGLRDYTDSCNLRDACGRCRIGSACRRPNFAHTALRRMSR